MSRNWTRGAWLQVHGAFSSSMNWKRMCFFVKNLHWMWQDLLQVKLQVTSGLGICKENVTLKETWCMKKLIVCSSVVCVVNSLRICGSYITHEWQGCPGVFLWKIQLKLLRSSKGFFALPGNGLNSSRDVFRKADQQIWLFRTCYINVRLICGTIRKRTVKIISFFSHTHKKNTGNFWSSTLPFRQLPLLRKF